jgi:hypothetical protein
MGTGSLKWLFITCFTVTACLIPAATAQEEEPTGEEAETGAAPEEAAEEPAKEPEGDVIVLTNGDRITGFQVIRATHLHFVLEGFYDPETQESMEIELPRGQVKEVIYDDIDPVERRREAMEKAKVRERTTVEGARLSDELYSALEMKLGEPEIDTTDMTLTDVVAAVNERVENVIVLAPAVSNSPRPWNGTVPPDMSLSVWLDNEISAKYPGLDVVFEEQSVRIRPKGAAGGPPEAGPGGRGGRGGSPPAAGGRAGRGGPPPAPGGRGGTPPPEDS